jgi:tetratricopeptide (TPR) repeat protein
MSLSGPTAQQQWLEALNPQLFIALRALLRLAGQSWSDAEMQAQWQTTLAVTQGLTEQLRACGLIEQADENRYRMPAHVREALLVKLINSGDRLEAGILLALWLRQAALEHNELLTAWLLEHLANLHFLVGNNRAALETLDRSLSIRRRCHDLEGVARISWSIGSFVASQGDYPRAIPQLARAAALAEELQLQQAPAYRERLKSAQEGLR